MAKRQLTPEFREFLACLNHASVDYLLVGGFAVNHYGYHRSTDDIDFWIAVSEANYDRLLAAIRPLVAALLRTLGCPDRTRRDRDRLGAGDTTLFSPNRRAVAGTSSWCGGWLGRERP